MSEFTGYEGYEEVGEHDEPWENSAAQFRKVKTAGGPSVDFNTKASTPGTTEKQTSIFEAHVTGTKEHEIADLLSARRIRSVTPQQVMEKIGRNRRR